jgi:putative zinc finger/helix-turn-helix YgiT family protein
MYKNGDKCPVCGEGILSEQVITEVFKYKGKIKSVDNYHIFVCNKCAEELVGRNTLKSTEKLLTDFRRKVDGLLTSEKIKSIRKRLNLTQVEMAKFLNVGKKNIARYENGQVTQSKSMDTLLRTVDKDPTIFFKIKEKDTMVYKVIDIHSIQPVRSKDFQIKYLFKKSNYGFYEGLANAA